MKTMTFLNNFEKLAAAPNGLLKIRELILQLAVQGMLVPQDPKDEPAKELLQKIVDEKNKFAKQPRSKSKTEKKFTDYSELFELPLGWGWSLMQDLSLNVHYGFNASANSSSKEVRLLRITDIQNSLVDWNTVPGCNIKDKEVETYRLRDGDLLIARTGGTIGKSYLVKGLRVKAVFASYLIRIIPSAHLNPDYLKIYLGSHLYWKQLYEKSMGTGQPNVNGTSLKSLIVPLAPRGEQDRIVERVDELNKLCDQLEERQKNKNQTRVYLNSSCLHRLLTAKKEPEFKIALKRISDNFYLLYSVADNISSLRQTILQLAVQGKLVPQNPKDESAGQMLQRIKEERNKLIKAGVIKIGKPLKPISDVDISVALPPSWSPVKLGEIALKMGAGSTPLGGKNVYQEDGVKFLRSQNIWNNGLDLESVARISENMHQRMIGTHVQPDDILLNITGASIGRCALVPDEFDEANVSQHVAIIRLINKEMKDYLHLCLTTPYVQKRIMDVQVGVSREGLSMRRLREFVIPIPPIQEQIRIVSKVKMLMRLCNELETRLKQSQAESKSLMESIVYHLLNGKEDQPHSDDPAAKTSKSKSRKKDIHRRRGQGALA